MTSKNNKIQILVECAVMIALGAVLSLVKVYEAPLGGSVTLFSMLPVIMISIRRGTKVGIAASFVYSLTQLFMGLASLMSWGLTPFTWFGAIAFDYILAFTVLGLAGIFKKKGTPGILGGVALACGLRFVCHFISGTIFFGALAPENWNFVFYSLVYNGAYMAPEFILTSIGAAFLFAADPVRRLMNNK